MMQLPKDVNTATLQTYVENLADNYGLPALSLAIWNKGKLHKVATGTLNVETGVAAVFPMSAFRR